MILPGYLKIWYKLKVSINCFRYNDGLTNNQNTIIATYSEFHETCTKSKKQHIWSRYQLVKTLKTSRLRKSSPLLKVWLILKIVVKQMRPVLSGTLLSAVSFSNIIWNTILLNPIKFPLKVSLFALQWIRNFHICIYFWCLKCKNVEILTKNVHPGVAVITILQLHLTKTKLRFKLSPWHVTDLRWWESLTMVLAENKAKHLLSVNHTTKTIHRHHHFCLSFKMCLDNTEDTIK